VISLQPLSVDDDNVSFGNGHAFDEASAARDGLIREGPCGFPCAQDACFGLIGDACQARRVEAREEPESLARREALDCEPVVDQRAFARRGPVLGLVEEPCDSTGNEKVGAGLGLELPPELQRALRRRGVPDVRSV
jgi:hypothetical protein